MPLSCRTLIVLLLTTSFAIAFPTAGETKNNNADLKKYRDSLREILLRIKKKYHNIELEQNTNNNPLTSKSAVSIPGKKLTAPQVTVVTQTAFNNKNAAPNEPQTRQKSGIPAGQELILSIYIDKLYLADIFALKSITGAKISLTSFFEIVDFPIQIDFTQKTAKGWFINEAKQFELNFSGGIAPSNNQLQLTINGQISSIKSGDFIIEDDDIYVDGDVLSDWFNLNLSYNFTEQKINLQPQEALPIQLRLARRNRMVNNTNESVSVMPWKESSYQMLSSPLVDVQIQSSTDDKSNNLTAYSMLGSHDLAYLSTDYYIAGDTNKALNHARVKFSKYSATGKLFGFLPATHFEIGDINPVSISSQYNRNINRGFLLANTDNREIDNNRININGNIQPGWDVELYRNDILIDKQTSLQTGRYEFNDIDLLYGENNFEMILYGPQGQVERETKQVYIDKNLLAATETSYAFSISQLGKSILGLDGFQTTDTEGTLFSGRYGQGITDWFSISLGQSTLFSDNDDNTYNYSLGMNFTLFERLLLNTDVNMDQNNNHNLLFTAKTSIANHSLLYEFRESKNQIYIDNPIQLNENFSKTRSQQLQMSGNLLKNEEFRVNYNNIFQHQDDTLGNSTKSFFNQLSYAAGRYSLQHSLEWQQRSQLGSSNSDYLQGRLQLQGRIGPVYARFSSSYTVKPISELTNISTELSWQLINNVQSNVKLDYVPKSDIYRAKLGINWQHDIFNLSTNFTYDDDDSWNVGLFLRFGFGYDIDNDRTFMSSTSLANSGAINVRVFEDDNINGKFDEGENLVEGAKIKALQVHRQSFSNEDGFALLKNMPNNIITDIVIQQDTLGDPFLIPATKGVAITPRKGFLQTIDYPVVTSGEIDGTVYLTYKNGTEKVLTYATMNLKNENGELVAQTQTEFDGYYLFVDLIPGEYTVSIADDYIRKHKLRSSEGLQVNLTAQGDVINGSDFSLAQLNFTAGYVVNVGSFTNLKMLKVYWHLIQRRYRAKLKQTTFYVENTNTGRFQLNLAFYQDKLETQEACKQILEIDIQCNVEAFEFVSQ
jgi:hypothetical protein